MSPSRISGIVACLLLAAGSAQGEGMRLEPGKWEFKTTSQLPGQGAPHQSTNVQCVKDAEMDPGIFLQDSQGCTVSETTADAGSMRWKMSCVTPGGRIDGEAVVHSTGTTMQGSMKAGMTMNGQRFEFEQKWQGRRLGGCDEADA